MDGGSISSSAPPNHGMAQGPVEARSLSSITGIASNPPSYPRNPTQKKLDPLELYIVRVPGSKGRLSVANAKHMFVPRMFLGMFFSLILKNKIDRWLMFAFS